MKSKRSVSVAVGWALAVPLLALGDPFVYSDHWPSGAGDETATEVSIPDGTTATIATAADVARVARLTAITLGGSNAKVDYTASSALALSADVSGSGRFSAVSSGDLTLSGDNSSLLAPGCFFFSNTAVTVASRYGLGSTGSGTLHYWFGDKVDPFHFSGAGLTNDVPIRIHQGTIGYNFVVGPDNAGETLVIGNDFIFDDATSGLAEPKSIVFRNGVRFTGGIFGTPEGSTYICALTHGDTAEVWFEGDVRVRGYYFHAFDNTRYHLDWSETIGLRLLALRRTANNKTPPAAVCERDGILNDLKDGIGGRGTFDLNGFGQSIQNQMQRVITANQGGSPTIASATPATFTFAKYTTSSGYTSSSAKFSGKVNFTYAPTSVYQSGTPAPFTYTLTGSDAISDSSGVLTIGGSGKLIFADGAGWSGTNVVVQSGATLELNSDKAMTNTMAELTVEAGGLLVLRAGAACDVKAATISGSKLPDGRYTVVQLKEMGLPVEGDGLGCLNVVGEGISWNGWPTTPNAVADVPEDMTVYVSDDDVEMLEALGGINLRSGSAVICTNLTRQLNLSASLAGTGTFAAYNSERIVLSGDNSLMLSPGTLFFTNTSVVVSNRYGLGSSGTAMVHFFYGDKDGDALLFRDAGLVVDAPLRISATSNQQRVIGPESADDTLIFSNSFRFAASTVSTSADCNPAAYFRNKVRFSGGVFGTEVKGNGGHLYLYKSGDHAEVWFDSGVKPQAYTLFMGGDILYHLGWDAFEWCYLVCTYAGGGHITCTSDNLFQGMATGYGTSGNDLSYLDLNGYDQAISHFQNQYIAAQNPNGSVVVTSSVPATLTVQNLNNSTDDRYVSTMAKFCGAAAFMYSWTGTNEFAKRFSDTTGALTVEKGAFRLADGAGWGGTNVFVKSGARLMVGAESMPVAFGTRALLGHPTWTRLEIENGGVLELAASENPATVRSLVYNGMQMPAGTYNRASGVGIEGDGTLYVRSSADGEPGAMIIIR